MLQHEDKWELIAMLTGRRVCVGYNVGANNIWIAIACLIYCFDITEDPVSTSQLPNPKGK
jgi:hypothetical protein